MPDLLRIAHWRIALGLTLLVLSACGSPASVEGYLNELAAITVQMTRDSFEALPPGAAPTHEQVAEVVEARRMALAAIEALAPPHELEPEHRVVIATLEELVAAGDEFLDDTAALAPEAFREALDSSVEIDALANRVAHACDAVRLRAEGLGYIVPLAC